MTNFTSAVAVTATQEALEDSLELDLVEHQRAVLSLHHVLHDEHLFGPRDDLTLEALRLVGHAALGPSHLSLDLDHDVHLL
mgnify:CR=1 FL=1